MSSYFFTLSLFPPLFHISRLGKLICACRISLLQLCSEFCERALPYMVLRAKWVWIVGLGSLILISTVAIFYYPGLQLPNQEHFQLFTKDHVFEK